MSQVTLKLQGVSRRFKDVVALDDFHLDVAGGELVTLLGPSGCGKTTALRLIAGLDQTDGGEILVAGKSVADLPAHKRNMGMVFQSYSLFPNMNAAENVAYGLSLRGHSKKVRLARAGELLDMVGLSIHAKRFPHQLSGGQQQRVALARALAFEPDILLLDEPLSALDAQVRSNLRDEIRALQLKTGTTTIFVTHDQEEAMAISDRVAVMNKGKIEQIAAPDELYHSPASEFVAGFVGEMNRVPATLRGSKANVLGTSVDFTGIWQETPEKPIALVRPEALTIKKQAASNGQVFSRAFLGPLSKVTVELNDGNRVDVTDTSDASAHLRTGDKVKVSLKPGHYLVVAG
jgi:putative spermidine/putrescine transport system ATP-binding protein